MTRRDAAGYVQIGAILLLTCCIYTAMNALRPAPTLDKPPALTEPVYQVAEVAEVTVEPVNPTPLSDELYQAVLLACAVHDVPECVALGLIEVESGFQPDAVSPKGCYGLCQLSPKYFASGLDPVQNIDAGMEYLGDLLERYGDTGAALTAYNAGHDTGSRTYADKVLQAAARWEVEKGDESWKRS